MTHFCLSDTMLPSESEDAQRAIWFLHRQHSWTFWTNTTIICLAFFKRDGFFSFDRSAYCNENFVAVGSFINSQKRRFSEFERSLDNFKLELAWSKTSGLTTTSIKVWRKPIKAYSRKGPIGLLVWNNCATSWKNGILTGIALSKWCLTSISEDLFLGRLLLHKPCQCLMVFQYLVIVE